MDELGEIKSRLEKLEKEVKENVPKEKVPKVKKLPSSYNIFIGDYLRKHKGQKPHKELFADATAAWKAQKAPIDKKP